MRYRGACPCSSTAFGKLLVSTAREALSRPVDTASLAFFRVAFGLVMLWEVTRYFDYGWFARYWIEPSYNFPYA